MSDVPPAAGEPLRLTLLGQLDLRRADGSDVRAVLQQPKRLALLAYLALAGTGTWKRRDTLLAMFWPDLDETHARGALRRSLYFLRQACGGVLVTRGEDDVAVAPGRLWCDVVAFDESVAAGREEEALALYRGDLLDGFFVAGAPDAERWLDAERARVLVRAASAAWSLAERGPAAQSTAWARRAVALAPDDERGVRRLMQLLERHGDLNGALRAFADLELRLRLEGLSPALETTALSQRLRVRAEPAPGPAAHAPPLDPAIIAILPFAVRGGADLRYLGEGMVDLLGSALDGAGHLRVSDPRTVLAATLPELGASDAGSAEDVGRSLGAGWVVAGTIVVAGDRLRLSATLHQTGRGSARRIESQAHGETGLFEAVDELARELVAGVSQGPAARPALLAARTSASWPALKSFLTGEQAFRLGHYEPALEAFEQAVERDRDFSLAWYRVASARAAQALVGAARDANRLALRQPERLSPHARAMLAAQAAWFNGRLDDAERHYGAVVAEHPDDVEAWYLLGDVLFHGNPYRGRPAADSASAFRQAINLDPSHPAALAKLARLAALDGDEPLFDTYLEKLTAASPDGDQTLALRAVRALNQGRMAEVVEVGLRLRSARILSVAKTLGHAALHVRHLAPVESLGLELVNRVPSPELRAYGLLLLADGALAQGNWTRAQERWAQARDIDAAWALTVEALRSVYDDSPAGATVLERLRSELTAWNASDEAPRVAQPLVLHDGLQPHIRCYLLALASARLEDVVQSARWGEELSELGLVEGAEAVIEQMLRMLEATRRQLQGDDTAALRALEGARTDVWFQHAVASPVFAGAEVRLLRGSLLARVGRRREAIGWLMAIGQHSPWELALRVPALAQAGRVFEAMGARADARSCYQKAREQLSAPDEVYAPVVSELESRIAFLA